MKPWICPRCHKVCAPWLAQCFCGPSPAPITLPPHLTVTVPGALRVTDAIRHEDGSFELHMDE